MSKLNDFVTSQIVAAKLTDDDVVFVDVPMRVISALQKEWKEWKSLSVRIATPCLNVLGVPVYGEAALNKTIRIVHVGLISEMVELPDELG